MIELNISNRISKLLARDFPGQIHYIASSIFIMQSPQMILTVFVALTLFLQQGQIYFRLLDGLGVAGVPAAPAPPPMPLAVNPSERPIRISVQPSRIIISKR